MPTKKCTTLAFDDECLTEISNEQILRVSPVMEQKRKNERILLTGLAIDKQQVTVISHIAWANIFFFRYSSRFPFSLLLFRGRQMNYRAPPLFVFQKEATNSLPFSLSLSLSLSPSLSYFTMCSEECFVIYR